MHRAEVVTPEGRKPVAVKVLRPNVERRFRVDLEAFTFAANQAERLSAEARRLRMIETVATLRRSVALEMDLRLEAAALSEWRRTPRPIRLPRAFGGLGPHRQGRAHPGVDRRHPAARPRDLEAKGFDLKHLSHAVIQTFLRHALRDGFFHADMHPGKSVRRRDGKLTFVDFGIMGRLSPKERRFLAEILYGFITRNYQRTAEVHFEGAMYRRIIRWRILPRRSAPSASRSTIGPPTRFRWRSS